MRQSLDKEKLSAVRIIAGEEELLLSMPSAAPRMRFDERICDFLDLFSKKILADGRSRAFPDAVTLAFWMRKGNLNSLRKELLTDPSCRYTGRGMVFHVSPSNVPLNCMYSLVTGLLAGNANVVKIPSKDFEQLDLVCGALRDALEEMEDIKPYIVLVRYGHEPEINEALSEHADGRVIWGGDQTIAEIRKAPLPARAVEVDFADRYSLAVIDADRYLVSEDRMAVANAFYNDTYLTDQNACTSPRIVVWTGEHIAEAKEAFWEHLHELASRRYTLQPVQAVNKLTSGYLAAAVRGDVRKVPGPDNLITRIHTDRADRALMDLRDNSGYFYEYDCEDILEIRDLVDDTHCQTIAYLGDSSILEPLLSSGIKGVDRVVPLGHTMDWDFTWDGYQLMEMLVRVIRVR